MNNTNKPWRKGRGFNGNDHENFNSNGHNNNNLNHEPYRGSDLTSILFLSKRGMSRAPLAREMMRSLFEGTQLFGRIRTSSRGVTQAYDQCPVDARMGKYSSQLGYFLQGFSRFATIPDLASADIIITLDQESEEFVTIHKSFLRGVTRPIGSFFATGSNPYIPDPYERGDDEDVDNHYDQIVSSIEFGCSKLHALLPSLIS